MAATKTPKTKTITIRNLKPGEQLPDTLPTGFEVWNRFDREWVWLMEFHGQPVACMVAAPAHGLAILLRIVATKDAPLGWGVIILRRVLSDIRERGYLSFTTFLDTDNEAELKLGRICERAGAIFIPANGVWAAGSTDQRGK